MEENVSRCYICRNYTLLGQNNLLRTASHSGLPLFSILGSISGEEVCDTSSAICLDCLVIIESYDEHYTKAMKLQNRLNDLMKNRRTVKTEIIVKVESLDDDLECPQDEFYSDEIFSQPAAHVDLQHSSRKSPLQSFECPTCYKKFPVRSKLLKHQEIHTTERNFYCQICPKSFKTSTCLRIHRKTHNPQPRVLCDLCNESFTKKHSFIRHYISKHTSRKDFLCSHCPKAFSSNPTLRHHLFTHSEFKKECCNICNARFHTKTKLKRHARTHAEHKEYKCPICFKEFTQKYNVNAHIKTVHAESRLDKPKKEFPCSICSQTFLRLQKLRQHLTQAHQVVEENESLV